MLSCDATALDRAGARNIPAPKNHRALRQLAEAGEQRLLLVLLPRHQRHVIHLAADRALQDAAGGGHVVEPPEPVVVVVEQDRRVAGEIEIRVANEDRQILRRKPGGGLGRGGGGDGDVGNSSGGGGNGGGGGGGVGFGYGEGVVVFVGVRDDELRRVHAASLNLLPRGAPL